MRQVPPEPDSAPLAPSHAPPSSGGESAAFLRSAVHDLNNALTTIRGRIQLLLEDLPGDAPAQRDLEEMALAAARAERVVERLARRVNQEANPG